MAENTIMLLEEKRPVGKPVEEWTISELLSEGAREGLIRNLTIAKWTPVDSIDPNEMKRNRLIADVGATLFKTLARVQEAAMRQAQYDKWPELLAKIAAVKDEG